MTDVTCNYKPCHKLSLLGPVVKSFWGRNGVVQRNDALPASLEHYL